MNDIKLSIVIPVYNAIGYIDRIFEYFEEKKYSFELVFIDDCSSDGSYEYVLDRAKASTIQTVIIKNDQNVGAGITRNHGIYKANGEYISFLDSDDYFSDDYFNAVMPLLDSGYDMIVHDAYVVGEQKENRRYFPMFFRSTTEGLLDKKQAIVFIKGGTGGKIYKRQYILDNEIHFLELKRNEDMPFTKIATAKANTIYYISKPLYYYYQNPNSLTHNASLLTPENAQKGFQFVKQSIEQDYPTETEALFLVEYLYSTVLTNAKTMSGRELHHYVVGSEKMYPSCYKNKYIKELSPKFRTVFLLIRFRQFLALKMLEKVKEKIK